MLNTDLRPRGTSRTTQPSKPINLNKDPYSTCMKCGTSLSGVTKLLEVLDDLPIILNCGHVLCTKCVHLNEYSSMNRGRPAHCHHDFQCSICGLMSPPITIPNHVRVCERRYTKQYNGECKCQVCVFQKTNPNGTMKSMNNMAYCKVHVGKIVEYFCFQCGKHLCNQCYQQHREEFISPDHTINQIAIDNPKLEDTFYHAVVIHGNLSSLRDDAQQSLDSHLDNLKNLRNSLGCYFISIINAAIGRFCQLHCAVQLEEEKLKKAVAETIKNIEDAQRRIVIGKEMDDFARSKVLMPEQFVANAYKASAQKMFRDAVDLHNIAIQEVRTVKSQDLQFHSKHPIDDIIQKVCTAFNGFTVSNTSVVKQYEVPPFSKLFDTVGAVLVDTKTAGFKLNISDFSTHNGVPRLKQDGFSRFTSGVTACGLNGDLSSLHPTLLPNRVRERYLEQAKNPNGKLSVYTDPKQPSTSTSNASAPSSSRASASSSTSLVGSPNLPTAEDRSKKQEHLLNLIRSAGYAEQPAASALVNELRKQTGISHRAEGKRLSVPNKRYADASPMPQVTIVTRGSKYDRMREDLMARNPEIDRIARTPLPPPPPPQHSQPSTSTSEQPIISISTEFMDKLYNSMQFKALSPDHQFYVLKQAQMLSEAEEERRRNPNFSHTDHLVILQLNQVKLQTLINKLYNVEKSTTMATNNFQQRSLAKLPFHISTEPLSKLSSSSTPYTDSPVANGIPSTSTATSFANCHPSTSAGTPVANGYTIGRQLLPMMAEVKQEVVEEEEIDVKPDVEELKRQMRKKTVVTVPVEEKAVLIETPKVETNTNGNLPQAVAPPVVFPTPPKPAIQDGPDGRLILRLPRPPPRVETPSAPSPTVAPPTVAPPRVAPQAVARPTVAPQAVARPTVAPPTVAPPKVAPPKAAPPKAAPPRAAPPKTAPPKAAPPRAAPPRAAPPAEPAPQFLPSLEECLEMKPEPDIVIDDNESVRTMDDDNTHSWCYICNDNKEELFEEEKGICTTCPRVFHKSCTIPKMRGKWSDDENWQCLLCTPTPVKKENESKTLMTDRNRFLCQTVLMKCFGTRKASLLMRSFAEPRKTLDVVSKRLEEDHPDTFETVDDFIEGLNEVVKNAAIYNSPTSLKGTATQKIIKLFQKAVKTHLPEWTKEKSTSRNGSGGKRRK